MASSSSRNSLKHHFIIACFLIVMSSPVNGGFTSIFSFGDSLTDTGNLLAISISESRKPPSSAFPPNGRTFFHGPTGRRCDGRLAIDFLAEALGFPFLRPYYGCKNGRPEGLRKGVNFAVAGASALNSSFLAEQGIYNPTTNMSLGDQLNSFNDLLPSLCLSSSECKELLGNSLIVMGEIGGNDYNHAFELGTNIEKVRHLVPLVVDTIASAINDLIELGAVTFLVPGNYPIGCTPAYLTSFQGSNNDKYDPSTGCLTWLNQFTEYHNELLRKELEKIRNLHPDINIIYVDNYNNAMRFYNSPNQFGFRETIRACCGGGGLYNYNSSRNCGYPPVKQCCSDPSSFVSWDGVHYTEAANKWLANAVFEELVNTFPSLNKPQSS
ncbi:Guard-cell-enriched GDSL Lipase 2 [Hibiscus trionum]|uniref:Guard-cell-enriched GDSL Lipase 2 n=1 Tax=Hibiscus trionum TaxID=183268 RepID=A0A9W7GSX1_HIBTR|nr:Guard-cell-enriched GDSL Lipase 2 [Hibiscus trionum]